MTTTNTTYENVTVKFVVNEKGNPPGKLADAELHFNDGALAGLKLIGFGVQDRIRDIILTAFAEHEATACEG